MKLIYRYMKPFFPRMVLGFVIKFLGTVMDLLLPWILAYIIDEIVPHSDIVMVFIWGGVMLLCAVIAVLGNIIANRMASAVSSDSIRVLRNDVFSAIMDLSCRQVDEFSQSTLISRMTSDTYNVHQIMGSMQRLGVRAPILLIGGIAVTMTLDPVLSFILVCTLPFLAVVVFYVAKNGIPLYNEHQKASDLMIGRVRESISGIRVIKALSKGDYERERFENINSTVVDKEKKAGITMALTSPVMNFLLNMGWVAIIIVGAVRVNAGLTAPGKIIAFLTYFTIILNAMLSITRLFVMFSRAGSSAARIEEILEAQPEILKQPANDKVSGQSDLPYIVFDDVSFSYNGRVNNISNISFSVEKGQRLGIIGATGSGKSTIINLLMRFYDASSGNIYIDGRDVRSYDVGKLRELFGAVFQNDMLFEDTVLENIKLDRQISDQGVEKAAETARIDSHIRRTEHGYNSYLPIRGNNLSGGQKQRMLIARAVAGNPSILVLDDSSSALDYKTDAGIRKNIRKLGEDITTIIVAQRVSSVMDCDKILVIDEGRIAGVGSHDELMKNCRIYERISMLQQGLS